MITIEEGIVLRLKAHTGLKALIVERIHPLKLPQSVTLPAVTYQRISTPREITHDQGNDASDGGELAMPRFQFTAWAETFASAKAVSKQIRKALNGYKGTLGTGQNTVKVYGMLAESEMDFYDPDSNLHWTAVDYFIHHEE